MPRTYIYRTLRSDFIDLCDGDCNAALALDYFWQQGQKLVERQLNDSSATPYIPLGWGFGLQVILIPISKNSLKRAVALLIGKGFITPHPANGQVGTNQVNRYRVNLTIIQAAINLWSHHATSIPTDLPRSAQTYPSVYTDLPPLSPQTEGVGLHRPQESVKESVKESPPLRAPAAVAVAAMTIAEIDELLSGLLGRHPTKHQQAQMVRLLQTYPPDRIRAAVAIAAGADKRSVNYVEGILRNAGDTTPAAASAPAAPRAYYTAPDEPAEMTAEEKAEVRAQLKALRGEWQ